MRAFALILLVSGCTYFGYGDDDSGSGVYYPDASEQWSICPGMIFDGYDCDTEGAMCMWAEGIDAGAPLPVSYCKCHIGEWRCTIDYGGDAGL